MTLDQFVFIVLFTVTRLMKSLFTLAEMHSIHITENLRLIVLSRAMLLIFMFTWQKKFTLKIKKQKKVLTRRM